MASTSSAEHSGLNGNGNELTAAQKLMQRHDEAHQPVVEDVPDEDDLRHGTAPISSSILESTTDSGEAPGWVAPISSKAAGKQKADPKEAKKVIDTQSEEFFPSLGGGAKPVQNSAPKWGTSKPNGASNGTSAPASGVNTPTTAKPRVPQSLAGSAQGPIFVLQPREVLGRKDLKRPIPEIIKDINKKTRANLSVTTGEGGVLRFSANGPVSDSVKHQAFRDLGAQICQKSSLNHPVPRSAKAHIIGKAGANIKSLQEATGARIQLPKDDGVRVDEDDDEDILVKIEGTPFAIALAKAAISKTLNDRPSNVNTKVKNIPAEFYPFISGANNAQASALEDAHGIQIRVPAHTTSTSKAPTAPAQGQRPVFAPATDNHITLAGDRAAVSAARAEIERIVQQLKQQLILEQFFLSKARHQYIIGERGIPHQDFFAKTGCSIIIPGGDEEEISVVGPSPEQVQAAIDHAMDLAGSMQSSSFDISRAHRNTAQDPRVHARNVTQYLRDRREIDRIEKLHDTHIVTPVNSQGADPWEIFYRHGPNNIKAQSEIIGIVNAHPPARVGSVPVDPFYHAFIKKDIIPAVKKDYGVHVVVPAANETGAPVLLVFEGKSDKDSEYQVPRGVPNPAELKAFKQGIDDARKHILDIINAQAHIISTEVEVPKIFHEKLRKFIKNEQQQRAADQIPVRVSAAGTTVTLRGPAPAVEALKAKVNAFIAEATEDEKERGFTLSFDYPQKHANQLIGKQGSNIKELREKFDVEITVDDGKVTLKGPKAKAEAAKTHITSLGRQWADETTHVLKVEPSLHGELIGKDGIQINRLQDRYKVQIHFPQSARAPRGDQSNGDATSDAGRRSRREQAPDEVSIKGSKKGADGARDELLELLQYAKDNSNVVVVAVQAGQIPSLIGSKGSGLEEIREASKARIDIPKERESDPTTRVEISIRGTKAQVAAAKKLIEEKRNVFDSTVTKTLAVDKKHHRSLIGKEGSVLRDIVVKAGGSDDRRELAKTVQFPKAEADGNLIKVEGKEDIVDKIIAAFESIVSELASQTSEVVEVPTSKHRSLIGRGGEAKRDIEKKFNVSIDIPRQGSEQTGVKIAGQPADVEKAKVHIEELIKEQEGEAVQVPRKVHHSISENGQFFRKLRNDLGVTVDHGNEKPPPKPTSNNAATRGTNALPLITDDAEATSDAHSWNVVDSSSDLEGDITWLLRGSPESLAKAKSSINAAVEQALQSTSTGYLILPDPRAYRHVIGQGGSKVNSIRRASGCKITVPKNQAENEAIEVVGSAEGVEKAKELILQAVKDGASNNGGGRNGKWDGEGRNGNANWD